MKTSNKIILILLAIVLVSGILLNISVNRFYSEKREKERIYEAFKENNNEVLNRIQTLDGKLAAQNRIMELKADELKTLYPELQKEIQNLKVKLNKVQSVSTTAFESEKQITTLIKDSTILDTVKVRIFNYRDDYYTIKGIARLDTQNVNIQMRDTLLQVVYKGKRIKPHWWIFSKRQLEQRVALKNPDAKIEYSKIIKVD